MSEMEDKLGAILSNPAMMQQIMSMAQTLGNTASTPEQAPDNTPSPPESTPAMDSAALQKLLSLASQTGIDANQKALLHALSPYLSHDRIGKLEKAMRSAKLANLASSALNSGVLNLLTGR